MTLEKQELDRINTEVSTQSSLLDQAIAALQGKAAGGSDPVIQALNVAKNGTYIAPSGVDGYSPVLVNVPIPDGYIRPNGELEVTENGTHDVTQYASVNVNVAASGGLPDGVAKIASGTYTPTSDVSSDVLIEHNLGVKPDFCWWVLEDDVSAEGLTTANVLGCVTEKAVIYSTALTTVYNAHYYIGGYNASGSFSRTAQSMQASVLTETACCIKATTAYRLKAGRTYWWVCGVLD